MKKMSFLISLLVLSALVLAACGGANNNGTGANGTLAPGAEGTTVPGDTLNTPAAGDGAVVDATPSLAVEPTDAAVVGTPTVAVDQTAQPDLTGTPQSEVPVTGDNQGQQCVFNRMDNLIGIDIIDSAGTKLAEVDGFVIARDVPVVVDENTLEDSADGDVNVTPEAGADAGVQMTPTVMAPGAENGGAAAGASQVGSGAAPAVSYLVLDLENTDNDVLVPYGAFDFAGVLEQDVVDECSLMLTSGVTADALTAAPAFNMDEVDLTVDNWDADFNSYWTSQGGVPQTGEEVALSGTPVLVDDELDNINVRNYNGDDLGEVADFILDLQTGALKYAVMQTGGFLGLGERSVLVPVDRLQWAYENADDAAEADELGYFLANFADDAWENAPVIEDLNAIDFTNDTWDQEIVTYWDTVPANQQPVTP